ncbi:MAG: 5-(carboxyamino)imidazole ribonucleotide mutase [bacterium]
MGKLVSIVIGSDSDLPVIESCVSMLKKFEIPFELHIASAHRTPKFLRQIIAKAVRAGVEVFIAGAGGAAHLPGVVASETVLPVIGIPVQTKSLSGLDSLLSIVQMPGGIPVATVAIGNAGAKNAGILACQILAAKYKKYRNALVAHRKEMEKEVIKKSKKLKN